MTIRLYLEWLNMRYGIGHRSGRIAAGICYENRP